MKHINPISIFLCLVFGVLLYSCSPFISSFDQYAYVQSTSLKIDALTVIDLSEDEYSVHEKEVKELQQHLDKIFEYELHRPKNGISTQMWFKLKDDNGHLLGGFISKWKKENKLSKGLITELKPIISQAFDEIAELESKKIKPSQVSTTVFK